jgi:5'-nucleotidase
MNYLAPDVVALGNHEFDYGLPHLLFLEKVANFPIVNANLYIKGVNKRLMKPYCVIRKAGLDVFFTGIITEKMIDSISQDKLIGSFITLQDAAAEVGKMCNAYKNDDIDLTVLLTHIGLESDKELAKLMKREWGVDAVIGGHSQTVLEKPEVANGIPIVQAGVGTTQIGRLDLLVDDDANSIAKYEWKLIPIKEGIAEPDSKLVEYINSFKEEVDRKYNSIPRKLSRELTRPQREVETEVGNLFADAIASCDSIDLVLLASGSIRSKKLGPLVTLGDFLACFPYNDSITRFTATGNQLWKIFSQIMRKENRNGEGECYQVNSGTKAVYDDGKGALVSLEICGEPVQPEKNYTLCIQQFHFNSCDKYLGVTQEELLAGGKSKVVTTSASEVIEEFLRRNQNADRKIEGRIVFT